VAVKKSGEKGAKANPAKKKDGLSLKVTPKEDANLRELGGSYSDEWNNLLANQTLGSLWVKNSDEENKKRLILGVLAALISTKPADEVEAMVIAQMIASHNAAMECYRRAMIGEQTFEGRNENLNQANKLSRTHATLLDALNRHRGKGQQKVTVEHVHVHSGGQAIVGSVEAAGGGVPTTTSEQPHALAYAPGQTLPRENPRGEPMPVAGDEERPLPNARRNVAGRSEG
jgi:hypothetical protein